MAHHGGPLVELADHLGGGVRNLLQGLPCEDLRVGAGFLDRFRVVRPRGRYTRVAVLLEQTDPVVPAARQQPEPVDEHDRRLAARVGLTDLALLALGDLGHGRTSFPWAARSTTGRIDSGRYLTITARITHIGGRPSCSRSGLAAPEQRASNAAPWRQIRRPAQYRGGERNSRKAAVSAGGGAHRHPAVAGWRTSGGAAGGRRIRSPAAGRSGAGRA